MTDQTTSLRAQLKALETLKTQAVKAHDFVLAADLRDQEVELKRLIDHPSNPKQD
jgi:protein-arginine kinase activator protein McsA